VLGFLIDTNIRTKKLTENNVIIRSLDTDVPAAKNLISGYANLAEFPTEQGFGITKGALAQLTSKGCGPPIAGHWGGRTMFNGVDVLSWAQKRMLDNPGRRRRRRNVRVANDQPKIPKIGCAS
jgi:hypothetical protein